MALNSNHTVEELGEIKCVVIEKNCGAERVAFLKNLLEHNHFTVVFVKSPPPKSATKPASTNEINAINEQPITPDTFTIGVTDLSFSLINAIYNRELKTNDGKIVMPNYWKQLDPISKEDSWYWKK